MLKYVYLLLSLILFIASLSWLFSEQKYEPLITTVVSLISLIGTSVNLVDGKNKKRASTAKKNAPLNDLDYFYKVIIEYDNHIYWSKWLYFPVIIVLIIFFAYYDTNITNRFIAENINNTRFVYPESFIDIIGKDLPDFRDLGEVVTEEDRNFNLQTLWMFFAMIIFFSKFFFYDFIHKYILNKFYSKVKNVVQRDDFRELSMRLNDKLKLYNFKSNEIKDILTYSFTKIEHTCYLTSLEELK